MKAIIEVDVPDYQIGQEVSIYFKDTMMIKGIVQEPCGDCISRQAVLEKQYRIDDSATLSTRDVVNVEDIEEMPSVTPTQNCVENALGALDCISRQAIDKVKELMTDINGNTVYAVKMSDIRQLPSVNPQDKIGHWIWCVGSHKCSNCEEYTCFSHKELLRYCPNCGADMRGEI